jgi:pimeloyl-ACP methyl ester carboxylesterase
MLKHYYTELQKFNFVENLIKLKSKILIIYGENDSVISINEINTFQQIPDKIIVKIDNQGHFIPLTNPYGFNKLIKTFLLTGEI